MTKDQTEFSHRKYLPDSYEQRGQLPRSYTFKSCSFVQSLSDGVLPPLPNRTPFKSYLKWTYVIINHNIKMYQKKEEEEENNKSITSVTQLEGIYIY